MTKEDILSKVKKLLAVAEGSNYEQEAQNAMLKAQEFMLKHNLTMEDIEFKEELYRKNIEKEEIKISNIHGIGDEKNANN